MRRWMKIFCLLALLAVLTACGREPTLEQLMEASTGRTAGEGRMEMSMVLTNIASELTFGVEMEAEVAYDQKVSHTKGTFAFFLNGLSYAITSDTYADLEKGLTYDYDKDSKHWNVSDEGAAENNNLDLSGLAPADFDSLTVEPHTKGQPYTVTGELAVSKLMTALGAGAVSDQVEETPDLEGIKAQMTYTFGEKTRKLEKIEAHAKLAEEGDTAFTLNVTYTVTAETSTVTIPPEVLG